VRKVGAEPRANSGSRAKRPRWPDYARLLMILVMVVLRMR